MKRVPLLLIASLLGGFLVIGILVRYSILQPLDQHVTVEVQESSGVILDRVMLGVTFFGSPAFLCVATILLSIFFYLKNEPRAAAYLMLTFLSLPFDLGLKEIWARARPDEKLVHVTGHRFGFSFPSGHTLMATAFYGALAVICWLHVTDKLRRNVSATFLALLPIPIGLSRIYLGAHWVSDVIGGYVGGLILLFVLTVLLVPSHPSPEANRKLPTDP